MTTTFPSPPAASPGFALELPASRESGRGAIMGNVQRRVSSPVFVGREAELGALDSALAQAARSRPAFVFVGGESGVGKTRLLTEFESRARAAGARVLVGHCLELGGAAFPYAPVVDALRPIARDGADLADTLPRPSRAALAELLPELAGGGDGDPEERDGGAPPQARLFEALLTLIERLGRDAPLVLMLEDVHWADSSTRDFLTFLVRSARSEPLCLVVSYRSDELHRRHPLRPVLAELERAVGVERLALERFSSDEVAAQLAGILDAPPSSELIARLYERAQGNAFFTEELLAASRDGAGELPETLRDALLMRVEGLSAAGQEVVRTVSGEWPMSHELLCAVCPLEEADLLAGLREAIAHQVLVTDADGHYTFRHGLVGEAVQLDLLPGERSALHHTIASALDSDPELLGDSSGFGLPALLACHWEAAHELPRALEAAVRAGRAAQRVFAPSVAGQHLDRALELWARVPDAAERAGMDHAELLLLAAVASIESGLTSRAIGLVRQALAEVDEAAEPVRAATLHEHLGSYLRLAGQAEESAAAMERAMALMPSEPPSAERARLLERYATNLLLSGRFERAAELAAEALDGARAFGGRALESRALNTLGAARVQLGDLDGIAQLQESLAVAEQLDEPEPFLRAAMNLADALDLTGRTPEALDVTRRGLAISRERIPEPSSYDGFLAMQEINDLLRLGRLAEAERLLPDRVHGDAIGSSAIFLHQLRGWVALLRGDHATAQHELDAMRRLARSADDPQWQEPLATLQAELALAQGRIADARAAVADGVVALSCAQDLLRATRLTWMGARVEAEGAARAAALGDSGADLESAGHVEQLVEALEEEPLFGEGPYNLTLARGELGRLAHAVGETPPDPEPFRAAAEGFRSLSLPFQAAYARFREAEALVSGGDRAAAAEPLRAAAALVTELGAHGLAREIEALARRARIDLAPAGGPSGPEPRDEDDPVVQLGLTPRELEVLLLVAEGRTNREIGAELFMSEKTASVHVSRILAKLGVGGRVEAAAVAHRLGLTRPEDNVPAA